MKITFSTSVPVEQTLAFEAVYEDALAMSLEYKRDLERQGWIALWMFVGGKLAGEMYGLPLWKLEEPIVDCDKGANEAVYCYSSTVLPEFQGQGLSKILKAAWLGMCWWSGAPHVVGHATSPAAKRLNEFFGAVFTTMHERWYGTERTAEFYRIDRGAST